MNARFFTLLIGLLVLPLCALATIKPGESREISGALTSVDVAGRAVVVTSALNKNEYRVGVTVPEKAMVRYKGKETELEKLPVGNRTRLLYTREGDRLLAVELEVYEGKK